MAKGRRSPRRGRSGSWSKSHSRSASRSHSQSVSRSRSRSFSTRTYSSGSASKSRSKSRSYSSRGSVSESPRKGRGGGGSRNANVTRGRDRERSRSRSRGRGKRGGGRDRSRDRSRDQSRSRSRGRGGGWRTGRKGGYSAKRNRSRGHSRSLSPQEPTNRGRSPNRRISRSPSHHSTSKSPDGTAGALPNAGPALLHVSSLTNNVRAPHLKEIFGTYGKVKSVELAVDSKLHLPQGYATVEFETPEEAEQATLYLDGGQVDGNKIKVDSVLVKKRRGGGRDREGIHEGRGRRSNGRNRGYTTNYSGRDGSSGGGRYRKNSFGGGGGGGGSGKRDHRRSRSHSLDHQHR